jgi:hypothetical protein
MTNNFENCDWHGHRCGTSAVGGQTGLRYWYGSDLLAALIAHFVLCVRCSVCKATRDGGRAILKRER